LTHMGIEIELSKQPMISSIIDSGPLQAGSTGKGTAEPTKQIGLFKAIFLVTRSLIGVGVLTQPHMNNEFGYLSIAIAYPIIAIVLIYLLSIFPKVANRVGYNGSNLEEFIEIVVGKKTGLVTMVFILMFNVSVSVCGVIFSVKFVNYS